MEKSIVTGCTYHSEKAAELRRAAKYYQEVGSLLEPADIAILNDIMVYANMVYDKSRLEIHNDPDGGDDIARRIKFTGKVTSIRGDNLPFNIAQVKFERNSAPEVTVNWNLSDDELIDFIKKGAVGTNHDADPTGPYKKPKGAMQLASLYTDAEWSDEPIHVNIIAMQEKTGDKKAPSVYVDVVNPHDIQMNSRISGYENISQYTESVKYVENDMAATKEEMFAVHLDNEDIIGADKKAEKESIEQMPDVVESPVYLSPEEQKEADTRTEMRGMVSEIVASRIDESQVDASAAIGEKVDVPESAVVDNDGKSDDMTYIGIGSSDSAESASMSDEDLEALHLIEGTGDSDDERDKRAAQEKLQQAAMQRAIQQTAEINKAKTEGESVIDREKTHEGSGNTISPV